MARINSPGFCFSSRAGSARPPATPLRCCSVWYPALAGPANAGYQTEQQRKGVAGGLADPARDEKQKPGELIRAMGLQPGMTAADVGTGIGYMLPFLSRRAGPTGRVIAEDIFDDFLASAKQRAANLKLAN